MIWARPAVWFALAAALLPQAVQADMNQKNSSAAWRQADHCAQQAFLKFPDYTPESNAKREAARRACLRDHRLPEPGSAAAPRPGQGKL